MRYALIAIACALFYCATLLLMAHGVGPKHRDYWIITGCCGAGALLCFRSAYVGGKQSKDKSGH